MTFREAIVLMTKGEKVKLKWWSKEIYIELRDDGFYDNKGERKFLDTKHIKGIWELYEE